MNHMVGPWSPIGPWLSHKVCSTVNITPILSTKVAIDCSHHELYGTFKPIFSNVDAISHFEGYHAHFLDGFFGKINKNKVLSEVIERET